MSEHTKEPWKADTLGGTTIWAAENGGACIADCGTSDLNGHVPSRSKDEERANARRIVDCVNAFAGVSEAKMEHIAEHGGVAGLMERNVQRAQQRDKFEAALRKIIDTARAHPYAGVTCGEIASFALIDNM